MQIFVDPISLTMMLIITGVGGLIILYSLGYMAGEDEERRYFAYMSLFVFSMLLLVMGGNFLLLLAGWGLVGLASYLLIGYYHDRPEAVAAAKKAFIMNAIGDAAMALGLFLLIAKTGSLNFSTTFAAASSGQLSSSTANLVALGLLAGAVAKSAQLPLQTWLPDAMEGPTPVSALIHAATMVTAGVYLIVRANPIFEAAPDVQHLAAVIGAVTLLMAGLIALVQWDIKRVIAYSTMSQIGYMFLAAGIGAYDFAMFQLMTHAFFKALLFLAAGIVIHRLAGEQDIRRMGGLHRFMPRTSVMFLIGTLALMGIPPLAGFWSKDAILASALATGGTLGWFLYVAGLLGAVLTGMYTFRLYFLVFHGAPSQFVLDHLERHAEHAARGRSCARPRARSRRGAALDADPRRRPHRARRGRGLRRHPGRRQRLRELDRRGGAAARRADDRRGLRDEPGRGDRGRDRRLRRLAGVQERAARSSPRPRCARSSPTSSTSTSSTTPSSRAPRSSSRTACATRSRGRSCRARSARSAPASARSPAARPACRAGSCARYALVIAASVAVLVVVFVAVR